MHILLKGFNLASYNHSALYSPTASAHLQGSNRHSFQFFLCIRRTRAQLRQQAPGYKGEQQRRQSNGGEDPRLVVEEPSWAHEAQRIPPRCEQHSHSLSGQGARITPSEQRIIMLNVDMQSTSSIPVNFHFLCRKKCRIHLPLGGFVCG